MEQDRRIIETGSPFALVDVGSNSVRLVIYNGLVRAPLSIHNEKALCGLGRTLNSTGRLTEEVMQQTLLVLARFIHIAHAAGARRLEFFATAAAREAENGSDFIRKMEKLCRTRVRVLSGQEEARLATLGVMSCTVETEGFVGDLGGGSLELAQFSANRVKGGVTLPAGALRLVDDFQNSRKSLSRTIDKWLNTVDWLPNMKGRDFYAVGGAWRNLAKLHMHEKAYPLHVIHHYTLSGKQALKFAKKVCHMSEGRIAKASNISANRREILPCAALILSRLLQRTRPERLIFSSAGVRDGLLFDQLPPDIQTQDPLLALCAQLPWTQGHSGLNGRILHDWIAPIFIPNLKCSRLLQAACLLSEVGRLEHPDYRANHVLTRIIRLPTMALTHWERAFLGLAVASRYGKVSGPARSRASFKRLLSRSERAEARAIGRAMRLAHVLSGGVPDFLGFFCLSRHKNKLILHLSAGRPFVPREEMEKCLADLAQALGCKSRIEAAA